MSEFKKGDVVKHPTFGIGTVAQDEDGNKVEVLFDRMGRKQLALKYSELSLATDLEINQGKQLEEVTCERRQKTFNQENGNEVEHFMGSHWEPFYEDHTELFKRLPEIIPHALVAPGFSDLRNDPQPAFESLAGWPDGFCLSWPNRKLGLLATLKQGKDANDIVSIFPFAGQGSEHTLTINSVHIWEGGMEAQIDASFHEAEITFFDCFFVRNRNWYCIEEDNQFILCGIAYDAHFAEDQLIMIHHKPKVLAALLEHAEAHGYEPPEAEQEMHTKGMTAFLPIPEWDRDDHSFRGIVRSVKEAEMLEQSGWVVRARVICALGENGEKDFDLDILITRKAWKCSRAPEENDEIEGALWLQGYLWYPHLWQVPDYET